MFSSLVVTLLLNTLILSVESQKGIITIQWCTVESHKGTIIVQSLYDSSLLVLNEKSLNSINALLVLSPRYFEWKKSNHCISWEDYN